MLVYKFGILFDFSFICSFGFCANLFSSMSVCGDVRNTMVSLLLPVASGTSVTHLAIALCAPLLLFLPYFDVICDLSLNSKVHWGLQTWFYPSLSLSL